MQIVFDDQLRGLFGILYFQHLKVASVLEMRVIMVDGVSVGDDAAVGSLAENRFQHSRGNFFAPDHLPQHISCPN